MQCITDLVGIKNLCESGATVPLFYLDDAEGIDRIALSQLAKGSNGSGKVFGTDIIEAASRFLMADIENIIPKGYSIKSSINSFCNTCTYASISTATANTGIIVKNISTSKNAYLSIDSLKVVIGSTGTYTIVLDDGILPKVIVKDFTDGTELSIININFKTTAKSVKIYFMEAGVLATALSCPTSKGCGCSGTTDKSTDLQVKGLLGGVEFATQYAFIPCASVVCSLDNVICNIVNQQPRLFALALFYRAAARYFSEFQVTQRNNRNASFDEEEKLSLADRYIALYYERLNGSDKVKGIADNLASVLNNLNDPCIECSRMVTTSWAIG